MLDFLIINDSGWQTGIVWTIVLIVLVMMVKKWARISNFSREVKTELQKATWPWDPKEKTFGAKYRELIDSTVVVLIAMVILSAVVSVFDFGLMTVCNFIFR